MFKTLTSGNLATLDGNTITDNTSGRLGGGIFAGANADMVVTNNVIQGNHAAVRGGALHTYYASVDLRNNTIVGNTALRTAGIFLGDSDGDWNLSLHNNVISGNVATYAEFAGGVHLLTSNQATFSFTYNDLADNLPSDAGGFDPSLVGKVRV